MRRIAWVAAPLLLGLGAAAARRVRRRQSAPAPLPVDVELLRDVEYGSAAGRPLYLHLLRPRNQPATPMPVLLYIHGGGWQKGSRDDGIQPLVRFARRGYLCASVGYRLSDEAIFPAQIHDCKCAVRFLRAHAAEYHLDPERIGVWGPSAGGHLAALLGTSAGVAALEGTGGWPDFSSRVQTVCDWFGPTDLLVMAEALRESGISERVGDRSPDAPTSFESRMIGGPLPQRPAECRRANPITYVTPEAPPFLILHGNRDGVVPLRHSELLAAALERAGVPVQFHIIRGAAHSLSGTEIDRLVDQFFDQHLDPVPGSAGVPPA